ncbi:MAG TPA: hypothetical protein PKY82_16065 [Pyrinomonadaceae bacterium]|nr:hypothetical protein [Pyrinomonadaceae bacterium]
MITIGIRVQSNSKIFYTIIDKDETTGKTAYITIDCLIIPLCLAKPERFNFIRNTLLDIFEQYSVTRAAIKNSEYSRFALKKNEIERIYIEGVIQECLAGSKIDKFISGRGEKLGKSLGVDKTQFSQLTAGSKDFTHPPKDSDWKRLNDEERDSILAAFAIANV